MTTVTAIAITNSRQERSIFSDMISCHFYGSWILNHLWCTTEETWAAAAWKYSFSSLCKRTFCMYCTNRLSRKGHLPWYHITSGQHLGPDIVRLTRRDVTVQPPWMTKSAVSHAPITHTPFLFGGFWTWLGTQPRRLLSQVTIKDDLQLWSKTMDQD